METPFKLKYELRRYIPLLILPVFFCVVLYLITQNFLLKQIKTNAEQTLNIFYLQVTAMSDETRNVSLSVSSDIAILYNSTDTSNMRYSFDDPNSICTQISIRKAESTFVEHIYYVCEDNETIYSDTQYYSYTSLPEILNNVGVDIATFRAIDKPEWNMFITGSLKSPFYVMPLKSKDGNLRGRFIFTVSLDKFNKTFLSLNARFACLYSDTLLIPSQPLNINGKATDALSSSKSVSALLGEKVQCFYFHSDTGEYTYLVAIPSSEYYSPLIMLVISFAVYVVLLLVISFLYLFIVSKKRHAEFIELVNLLPQESDLPTSYIDLVPVVQKALLDASDKKLNGQQVAKEQALHSIVRRRYASEEELNELLRIIGIDIAKDNDYALVLFTIVHLDNIALSGEAPNERFKMAWTIFNTVVQQMQDNKFALLCDNERNKYNVLIYCESPLQMIDVEHFCTKVCEFIRDRYSILMRASISKPTKTANEIPELLIKNQQLENFANAISSPSLVISDDIIKGTDNLGEDNFFKQEQILASALLEKKYDVIPGIVQSVLTNYVANASNYDIANSRLKAVAVLLSESLLTVKNTGTDLKSYSDRILTVTSVAELIAAVNEVFTTLAEESKTMADKYSEVQDSIEFIEKNLGDENLNVAMIAEAVGTIPQRLIPMFQKQLNMGVAEYVNYRRIESAKKLLTTTKLKVNQIAEQVGYFNIDTFMRNFKKLVHLTPSDYRHLTK